MTEKTSEIIYESSRPNLMDVYWIFLILYPLSFIIFLFALNSFDIILLLGLITMIFLMLFGFFGLIVNKNTIIYSNGVVPSYSGFKNFMRSSQIFIPFNKIKLIGMAGEFRDKVPVYYFLMIDGKIEYCDIRYTGSKAQSRLAEQLRFKCPNIMTIRIRRDFTDEGASPYEMPEIMKKIEAGIKF